jgi:hypothetical protein
VLCLKIKEVIIDRGASSETIMTGLISGLNRLMSGVLHASKDLVLSKQSGESAAQSAAKALGIDDVNTYFFFKNPMRHFEAIGNDTHKYAAALAGTVEQMKLEGLDPAKDRQANTILAYLKDAYSVSSTMDVLVENGDFLGAMLASRLDVDGVGKYNGR